MHVLINWLWQASALALIVGLLVAPWRGMSAAMRYGIWAMTLVVLLLLPLGGLIEPAVIANLSEGAPSNESAPTVLLALPALPSWVAIVLACLWVEWVAFSAVRLVRAATVLSEARAACQPFPAEREARLPMWLRTRREGRCASLALSPRVRGAALLGLRSPIIAVSPSLAAELTDAELDQVIVHEAAHVRRHDDVAALAQAIVDVVAGFHPAVRAVQARLSLEREMACDDWVVRVTGSAKRYAACLTRVAAAQEADADLLLPAAVGSGHLTVRVTRLLDGRRSRARASRMGLWAVAPLLAGLAVGLSDYRVAAAAVSSEIRSDAIELPALPLVRPVREHVATSSGDEVSVPNLPVVESSRRRPRRGAGTRPLEPALDESGASESGPLSAIGAASPSPMNGGRVPPSLIDARALGALDRYPEAADALPSTAETTQQSDLSPPSSTTPWLATANAGVAIGQGSQYAAIATAGFFSRMGKSIARVF